MVYFINNKYTRWYVNIIIAALKEGRQKTKDGTYYESHHIIPKCKPFNGPNTKDNRVLLTGREHFLCHWLLTRMCVGEGKMKMCFAMRSMTRKNCERYVVNSWQFAVTRKVTSQAMKGRVSPNKGKRRTPESRAKSAASLRAVWANGHSHSPDAMAKIRAVHVGAKRSDETRAKISAARRASAARKRAEKAAVLAAE